MLNNGLFQWQSWWDGGRGCRPRESDDSSPGSGSGAGGWASFFFFVSLFYIIVAFGKGGGYAQSLQ